MRFTTTAKREFMSMLDTEFNCLTDKEVATLLRSVADDLERRDWSEISDDPETLAKRNLTVS